MVTPNKHSIYECNIKTIDLLYKEQIITHEEKITLNKTTGIKDIDITTKLIEKIHIKPETIGEEISKYSSYTFVKTITNTVSESIIKELPEELTHTQFILPISKKKPIINRCMLLDLSNTVNKNIFKNKSKENLYCHQHTEIYHNYYK